MEWFKHKTASHQDPDISDAWDRFGAKGPLFFWTILEIYGREFNNTDNDGWLWLSGSYLRRQTRLKLNSYELLLSFYKLRERIEVKQNGNMTGIKVPKFIQISSNWTKRTKVIIGVQPTEGLRRGLPLEKKEVRSKKKKNIYMSAAKEIFAGYPRKIKETQALKNICTLLKKGDSKETLIRATKNYRAEIERKDTETEFITYPSNFFGRDAGWRDYVNPEIEEDEKALRDFECLQEEIRAKKDSGKTRDTQST